MTVRGITSRFYLTPLIATSETCSFSVWNTILSAYHLWHQLESIMWVCNPRIVNFFLICNFLFSFSGHSIWSWDLVSVQKLQYRLLLSACGLFIESKHKVGQIWKISHGTHSFHNVQVHCWFGVICLKLYTKAFSVIVSCRTGKHYYWSTNFTWKGT